MLYSLGAKPYFVGVSEVHHVLICLSLGIDSRLCALHRQREYIYNDEGVMDDLALEHAHDLRQQGDEVRLNLCKKG